MADESFKPAHFENLATSRAHVFVARPAFVEITAQVVDAPAAGAQDFGAPPPGDDEPLDGWRYEVTGPGVSLKGQLDERGHVKLRVANVQRKAKEPFIAKVMPGPPPAPPPSVPPISVADAGLGPAATRRRRTVNQIVDALRTELARVSR